MCNVIKNRKYCNTLRCGCVAVAFIFINLLRTSYGVECFCSNTVYAVALKFYKLVQGYYMTMYANSNNLILTEVCPFFRLIVEYTSACNDFSYTLCMLLL